jgi:hypothetical protein
MLLLPICIHTMEYGSFVLVHTRVYPEDGGSRFLRNVAARIYTVTSQKTVVVNTDDVLCRSETRRVQGSLPPGQQQQVLQLGRRAHGFVRS